MSAHSFVCVITLTLLLGLAVSATLSPQPQVQIRLTRTFCAPDTIYYHNNGPSKRRSRTSLLQILQFKLYITYIQYRYTYNKTFNNIHWLLSNSFPLLLFPLLHIGAQSLNYPQCISIIRGITITTVLFATSLRHHSTLRIVVFLSLPILVQANPIQQDENTKNAANIIAAAYLAFCAYRNRSFRPDTKPISPKVPHNHNLQIISLNMQGGYEDDEKRITTLTHITKTRPDVFGLIETNHTSSNKSLQWKTRSLPPEEEADSEDTPSLQSLLKQVETEYIIYSSTVPKDHQNSGRGLILYIRRDKWGPRIHGNMRECPHERWISVGLTTSEGRIRIFLNHGRPSFSHPRAALERTELIAEIIASQEKGELPVLMGDLNLSYNKTTHRKNVNAHYHRQQHAALLHLQEYGHLVDQAHPTSTKPYTWIRTCKDQTKSTYSSPDHIMVHQQLAQYVTHKLVDHYLCHMKLTDHAAISVTIQLEHIHVIPKRESARIVFNHARGAEYAAKIKASLLDRTTKLGNESHSLRHFIRLCVNTSKAMFKKQGYQSRKPTPVSKSLNEISIIREGIHHIHKGLNPPGRSYSNKNLQRIDFTCKDSLIHELKTRRKAFNSRARKASVIRRNMFKQRITDFLLPRTQIREAHYLCP